jgi:hypothetical protein
MADIDGLEFHSRPAATSTNIKFHRVTLPPLGLTAMVQNVKVSTITIDADNQFLSLGRRYVDGIQTIIIGYMIARGILTERKYNNTDKIEYALNLSAKMGEPGARMTAFLRDTLLNDSHAQTIPANPGWDEVRDDYVLVRNKIRENEKFYGVSRDWYWKSTRTEDDRLKLAYFTESDPEVRTYNSEALSVANGMRGELARVSSDGEPIRFTVPIRVNVDVDGMKPSVPLMVADDAIKIGEIRAGFFTEDNPASVSTNKFAFISDDYLSAEIPMELRNAGESYDEMLHQMRAARKLNILTTVERRFV